MSRAMMVRTVALAASAMVAMAVLAGTPSARAAEACPNASVLAGQADAGAPRLPDCRGLEQVSPAEKDGMDVPLPNSTSASLTFAAPSGGRVVYQTFGAFGAAPGGSVNQYLAVRGGDGWRSVALIPRQDFTTQPDFTMGFRQFLLRRL